MTIKSLNQYYYKRVRQVNFCSNDHILSYMSYPADKM